MPSRVIQVRIADRVHARTQAIRPAVQHTIARVTTLIACASAILACGRAPGDTHATDAASSSASAITVIGNDYAFLAPDSASPGPVTFTFRNEGRHPHEFNIVLLRSDVSLRQYIDAANAGQALEPLRESAVGVLVADGGQTSPSTLSTMLSPGRTYAIQCIFRDSAGAPTHRQLGMYKQLRVTTARPREATARLVIDTIAGMDYAYRYPARLSPGTHHLAFTNIGKQRHEMAMILLKKDVTVRQVLDSLKRDGDIDPLIEQSFGILHSPGGTSPQGILDVDILAGRDYMIGCNFRDNDKAPPHFALGMYAVIRGG